MIRFSFVSLVFVAGMVSTVSAQSVEGGGNSDAGSLIEESVVAVKHSQFPENARDQALNASGMQPYKSDLMHSGVGYYSVRGSNKVCTFPIRDRTKDFRYYPADVSLRIAENDRN